MHNTTIFEGTPPQVERQMNLFFKEHVHGERINIKSVTQSAITKTVKEIEYDDEDEIKTYENKVKKKKTEKTFLIVTLIWE